MSAPALILNANMKSALDAGFAASFEGAPERYFSAPGRRSAAPTPTISVAVFWPAR